ncbi:hypothetical protein QYE76_033050 [Lolium multiflorum]|uniref:Retrotransposon gag domain-containing protein n=1 Tax=Lolium multiflorum TaxID=4521 RepID=A0AAD8VIY3_LOLMU|nr:hypothetical protein QYE76_033050 [Lolium multiflorum]
MTEATATMGKVATKAGVSIGMDTENLKAEARVSFAGGNQRIACRMVQLYLIGPARTWLGDLPENSIFCWFDMKIAFEKHFRGTYKRPATISDMQACIQKKGETSRSFLTRLLATRNECENMDNRSAMHAFIGGLQRGGLLRHKLTCLINENNLTWYDMIGIASTHTAADDYTGGELSATAIPLHQQKKNRDNGDNNNSNKRKNPPTTRRAAAPTWSPWHSNTEVKEAVEAADVEAEPAGANSTLTKSQLLGSALPKLTKRYKRAWKHRPRGKGGKGKNKEKDEDSSEAMDEDDASPDLKDTYASTKSNPFGKESASAYHTFLGTPTVCANKSALRIRNATVPAVPPVCQLAPTVGHEVALARVHIRAGILDIAGQRTVSALVQRIYAMDFINDNAGCFANGGIFPKNGRIIERSGRSTAAAGTVRFACGEPLPPATAAGASRIIRATETPPAAMNVPPPHRANIARQQRRREPEKMLESGKDIARA